MPDGAQPVTPAVHARRHPAPWRGATAFALCLSCLFALVGCGEEPGGLAPPPSLEGPPRWRAVREEGPAGSSKLALLGRTPCRVRFRLELPDGESEEDPWRILGTGQTLQLWWSVNPLVRSQARELPHPGAVAADRTEPHAAGLEYQYEDRGFVPHRFVEWTRPGKGGLLHLEAVPPGIDTPLAVPGSIELATVAITDLASGRAALRPREARNQLVLPGEFAEGDRVRILRLFLDIAPLEAGR